MSIEPSTLRIDDSERDRVVSLLGQHVGFGRLTLSEFEARLDAIYSASMRTELDDVLVDLPDIAPPATELPRVASAEWARWALVGAICLLVWVATSLAQARPLAFWPVWVIGPWGIVLCARTWGGPSRRWQTSACGQRHTRRVQQQC